MTLQIGTKLANPGEAQAFPPAVLEKLAGRFRPTGACLVLMRPDGSMAYADPIAGAVFTPDTLARAKAKGRDPQAMLDDNDGHTFFEMLGDSFVTGPTRTNVNDFRATLIAP